MELLLSMDFHSGQCLKTRRFLYSDLNTIHLVTFLLILPSLYLILNDFSIVKYFIAKTIATEAEGNM
jgi:hypothetical protein